MINDVKFLYHLFKNYTIEEIKILFYSTLDIKSTIVKTILYENVKCINLCVNYLYFLEISNKL